MLSTLKIKPTKCWKIFPLWNGCFEEGVRVKTEMTNWLFCVTKAGKEVVPKSTYYPVPPPRN